MFHALSLSLFLFTCVCVCVSVCILMCLTVNECVSVIILWLLSKFSWTTKPLQCLCLADIRRFLFRNFHPSLWSIGCLVRVFILHWEYTYIHLSIAIEQHFKLIMLSSAFKPSILSQFNGISVKNQCQNTTDEAKRSIFHCRICQWVFETLLTFFLSSFTQSKIDFLLVVVSFLLLLLLFTLLEFDGNVWMCLKLNSTHHQNVSSFCVLGRWWFVFVYGKNRVFYSTTMKRSK